MTRTTSAVLALAAAWTGVAGAQRAAARNAAPADIPIIEPRYTRIIGADTLNIASAVMSPDGRWVVFSRIEGTDVVNLWLVPASGGQPVRLTSGRYEDVQPAWFPSSDRIVFASDRPSEPESGILFYAMVLQLDPGTGQPTGPPRQVSIEPAQQPFVSPDGQVIGYLQYAEQPHRLRLVPASGGSARTLAEYTGTSSAVAWTDSGDIYYSFARTPSNERVVMRVPFEGGSPVEVATVPGWQINALSPDGRYLIRPAGGEADAWGGSSTFDIATIRGRPVAGLHLQRNMSPEHFTRDGRALLAVRRDAVAPLTVLPVAGGAARRVNPATALDSPLDWTPDSRQVLMSTQFNGEDVLMLVSAEGGDARTLRLPERPYDRFPMRLSADGRYLLYAVAPERQRHLTLVLLELATGHRRELTRTVPSLVRYVDLVKGRGGAEARDDDAFLYLEERGERVELRATRPEGTPRVLYSFRASELESTSGSAGWPFGVYGDRVVFTRQSGDSTTLFVARAGEQPRALLTRGGWFGAPVWSQDGRRIACWYGLYPQGEARWRLMVLDIAESGEVAGEPRILDAGAHWGWGLRWMPDGRSLLLVGIQTTATADVWRVPLDPGAQPVAITRDDPNSKWWFELSPDGRFIAYGSYMTRGSSIWRADIGDVLTRSER